jgi:selenocysteine lyase/cysteine desulfurase
VSSEWEDVRADFPAVRRHVYLNSAAASPSPRPVREAVNAYYRALEDDGDAEWAVWLDEREEIRAHVARLVGAQPDEIAFVANTSTGINCIIDLIGQAGPVLTDELEFPTVTLPWIHRGIRVHFVPAVEGVVRLESFDAAHAPRSATIAVSHVQYSNGCRLDLTALGALKAGRFLVVSASQGLGAFPVDVQRSAIDGLACAGHKWLCAGYGAGFMYLRRELLARVPRAVGWMSVDRPFELSNREYALVEAARRVELGSPAFAGIYALGAAVRYLTGLGLERIAERVLALNMYLTCRLEKEGFSVLSPGGEHRSGQTLCAVAQPAQATAFLRENGIMVTQKPEGVRISTHFFNNEEDIDACVRGLIEYRKTTLG